MLFEYQKSVQRFLRDTKQEMLELGDITTHINEARRETAMRAQAIRRLTPIAAGLVSASVSVGGSGYTNPTVIITPPDFPDGLPGYPNGRQATALASLIVGRRLPRLIFRTVGPGIKIRRCRSPIRPELAR